MDSEAVGDGGYGITVGVFSDICSSTPALNVGKVWVCDGELEVKACFLCGFLCMAETGSLKTVSAGPAMVTGHECTVAGVLGGRALLDSGSLSLLSLGS